VLPRIGSVKVMWFELTLVQQEVTRAVETQRDSTTHPRWAGFDEKGQVQLVNRAEHAAPVLRGATVLWVDNEPQRNNAERNILARFGISTDIAMTSNEALALLNARPKDYDAVVSDIEREDEGVEEAGLDFLARMRRQGYQQPVIFYVTMLKPGTPAGAFGICARAGELFHLIFDALERTRDWKRVPALPVGRAQDE